MGGLSMKNINIKLPQIPNLKISLPQYGNNANIVVDDKMSDDSKNPVQNKVVKKYVDDEIIPKYEFWQSGKVYKVGSAVFALAVIDNKPQTVGMICVKEHTSESVDIDINDGYWDVQMFIANASIKDAFGNIIHETYVQKSVERGLAKIADDFTSDGKENSIISVFQEQANGGIEYKEVKIPAYTSDLSNDEGFITKEKVEDCSKEPIEHLILAHNSLYYFDVITSLILSVSSDVAIDSLTEPFECNILVKTGDNPLVIVQDGITITWAGDDVDEDGVFNPETNKTYEISIKKLGLIISARVGVI